MSKDETEFKIKRDKYNERFQPTEPIEENKEIPPQPEKAIMSEKLPEGFHYPDREPVKRQTPEEEEAQLAKRTEDAKARAAQLDKARKEAEILCAASGHVWAWDDNSPLGLEDIHCKRCDIRGIIVPRDLALRFEDLARAAAKAQQAIHSSPPPISLGSPSPDLATALHNAKESPG